MFQDNFLLNIPTSPFIPSNGGWPTKILEGFEEEVGCDADQYHISEVTDAKWIVDKVGFI